MDLRRLAPVSRWLGPGMAVVASAFVVRVLAREWDAARQALAAASAGWIGAAGTLSLAAMVAMALPWRRVLGRFGAVLALPETVGLYFVGEVGKYLPGGVWSVVGRAELARRAGVRRPSAYASVALSLVTLYLAAAVVAAPLLLAAAPGSPRQVTLVVLAAASAGVVALNPRLVGLGLGLAERLLRRPLTLEPPPWRASLGLVALYLPAWALVGAATWCVARSLDPAAGLAAVAGAAVVSWLAGFVVLGVPGGVGVREATFVALVSGMASGPAAATAVVARLLFIVVDVLGAVVALAWLRRSGLRTGGGGPSPSSMGEDGGPR